MCIFRLLGVSTTPNFRAIAHIAGVRRYAIQKERIISRFPLIRNETVDFSMIITYRENKPAAAARRYLVR